MMALKNDRLNHGCHN